MADLSQHAYLLVISHPELASLTFFSSMKRHTEMFFFSKARQILQVFLHISLSGWC